MATVPIIDGVAHISDPDADGKVTSCGKPYDIERDDVDKIASGGARYADDFFAEVASRQEVESTCEHCEGEAHKVD